MRSLKNEDVKTIFGYPGGSIMPVFDALYGYTRGEKKMFDHILVRHEQAAAHAAQGYARVSGEVGVALVTSGPGATNTLTGIADAMMDSTPIVVIAGQVGVGALGTDAFQEVDLVGVTQPISKWSYQIRRAEDVAWAVSRAFYIARSGRPGPVVLDFTKNALAAKRGFRTLKGFVNAVLRNISRSKEQMPLPDPGDTVKYLSIKYSMPEWIVNLWLPAYGREGTETLLKGLLSIHPVSLRFSTELTEAERESLAEKIEKTGVRLQQSRELPYVYLAQNLENVSELPGFAEGKFTVQDASSALAVEAAGICPGNTVMDLCAAPGGKTILAAEFAGEAGHVVSRDISEYKTDLIRENLERMNRRNVEVQVYDATVHATVKAKSADGVLMDVPCSGLGVMGKKRDIKYHATPESLQSITELQRQIVAAGWQYVKPHGVLLYSTCTIHRGENQEMAVWITENFPFVLEEERQLLPGTDETDGFYYARLRRKA